MNKYLVVIFFLLISGCQSQTSTPNTASSNTNCPEKSQGSLNEKNVEPISLQQGAISKSGNVSVGQQKGYSFDAKKGSQLSYKTKDDICILIYAPDSSLVTGNELKLDGKYTVQVSALKGSTSYTVEIGFGNSATTTTSVSSSSGSSSSSSSPSISGDFDQSKAEKLVKSWLDAKSKIFSPPFDRNLVKTLTTGPLYLDITKSNGSIDWLQSNNSYYSYSKLSIDKVWTFSSSGSRPSMKVTISEDRILYGKNGKPDANESGASTANWVYFFIQEDGIWKIHDYKKD
jgi:ARC6-like, IMS domain